jgi:hypothetical protein
MEKLANSAKTIHVNRAILNILRGVNHQHYSSAQRTQQELAWQKSRLTDAIVYASTSEMPSRKNELGLANFVSKIERTNSHKRRTPKTWPAPSKPHASPPEARRLASSSPPRPPANPRPAPVVSRSPTATALVTFSSFLVLLLAFLFLFCLAFPLFFVCEIDD